MENSFFPFGLLATGVTQHLVYPSGRRRQFAANLVPLMVVLTRPDGALAVAASWAVTFHAR